MDNTIGILAGMGPRSTAPFVDEVVTQCQEQYAARHDEEFPPMMIYSLPTPFYVDRPVDHQKMEAVIRAGLQRLEGTGVSFIAMPCNSAHRYYKALAAGIDVPLLNMIAESVARTDGGKRTTILGTRGTLQSGLYQHGLAEADVPFTFEPQWQDALDNLISEIKAGGQKAALEARWRRLLSRLEAAGVEQAVVACTDLQVVLPGVESNVAIVDSSRSLAMATVREYLRREREANVP